MKFEGPKATVGGLVALGVRQAAAWSLRCDRRATIDLVRFKPEMIFVEIKPRLVCTSCGRRDKIELDPDWRGYRPGGRM